MAKDEVKPAMEYPHNVLEAFGAGALMDFRVRMAFNLLQSSPALADVTRAVLIELPKERASEAPMWVAKFALELADEVMRQGTEKGWVEPIPDEAEIGRALRQQAKRTAAYQVMQQLEGQKFGQQEQAGQVIPVAPGGAPKGH